jgi:son of sevenless-like protein
VTNWVIHSILSEDTPKGRAKVMGNMISLLSALRSFRNYAGIMAVLSGLNSSPITRLKITQREVNPKLIKIHEAFSEMMKSESSFKAYREALRATEEAAVPFL